MQNAGLDKSQAGIKGGREVGRWSGEGGKQYQQPQTCTWYHSNGRKWRGLKSLLMRVKRLVWNSAFKKLRSWHPVPLLHGKQMEKQWKHWQTLFSWAPKSLQMVTAAMKLKALASWKKMYNQPRQHIKKKRHYFTNKGPSNQGYGFSSSHV